MVCAPAFSPSIRHRSGALVEGPPCDEATGGGGGGDCGRGALNPIAKIAVPSPNLLKPRGATLLHGGHTGHQQTREGDQQKGTAENCEIAKKKGEKLRTQIPPPSPCRGVRLNASEKSMDDEIQMVSHDTNKWEVRGSRLN